MAKGMGSFEQQIEDYDYEYSAPEKHRCEGCGEVYECCENKDGDMYCEKCAPHWDAFCQAAIDGDYDGNQRAWFLRARYNENLYKHLDGGVE